MAKTKKQKETIDIYSVKECPDCASVNLVYNEERQQIICRDCGLIYEPMAPELETEFVATHSFQPKAEAQERIRVVLEEEKPPKPKKAKKPKKKAKAKKKPAKKKAVKKAKPKKKAVKKQIKKAKPKKKAVKKQIKKAKPAKKPKAKPKKKGKGLFGQLHSRLKIKRRKKK